MKQFILAVDFDNTIVDTDESVLRQPIIKGLRKDAKEVLQKLHDDGHYIIINTCRNGGNLQKAIDYLNENEVVYDIVNANHPDNVKKFKRDNRKIFADFYIDDKNIGGIPEWENIYHIIKVASLKK